MLRHILLKVNSRFSGANPWRDRLLNHINVLAELLQVPLQRCDPLVVRVAFVDRLSPPIVVVFTFVPPIRG